VPATSIPAVLPITEPKEPPAGTLRLEFEVVQKCWVSVSRDGDRVLVKLLEPGEDLSFDAAEKFYVILGNAGGVRLKINGKRAKPPGNSGEVVKMMINTENVSALLATDEP
jgi:cytoskeleton protein RodZ